MPAPEPTEHVVTLLALDCSTERLALGVQSPQGTWLYEGEGGAVASAQLLPQARRLLQAAGIGFAQLECIAFGRGPGAFTGLRTACAVAQGLGFALGKPLVPIDSLLIVAEDAHEQALASLTGGGDVNVAVAMDARMDESYAAVYRYRGQPGQRTGAWTELRAPSLVPLVALGPWLAQAQPALLAGSALAAFGARVAWPAAAQRLDAEASRAAALVRLAQTAATAGQGVDAALALPLYLRDKVAATTAERAAAASASASASASALKASAP
jgi:tRNA threonylcarbamoyladenosine biosynthesis protein TsaB